MLEFIRTHRRLMQFILLLLILPSFAFFGLEGYSGFSNRGDVLAEVAGQPISKQEFEAAQREQMDQYRRMFGDQFDPQMLDTPAARQSILEGLIAQRALAVEAKKNNLFVNDQQLQQTILEIPGLLGPDGKFNMETYKSMLAAQSMTPTMFDARLRQDLLLQQVSGAVESSAFAPKSVATRLSDWNEQQREVQAVTFSASDYASKVTVTDEMLKTYYDRNSAQFEIPEQIKAEYLVLNREAVMQQISVSDADIKAYYDQNIARFTDEEQRRISHILVEVKNGASDAEKAAARKEAEGLVEQLRKAPGDFAKLAKEHSDDAASAERGGDLDFFSRGKEMLPQPLEEAAYKLAQGQISDVVESEFGFHIVRLTDIKPGTVQSLDEVKQELVAEIRQQQAAKKFSEMASQLNDIVYEQSESLQPAAEKLGLKVETVGGLTRAPNPALPPNAPFNHPKFLNALFSDEPIKNKRNTDPVEVAPGTVIAGRVAEYKPVTKRPFEEVRNIVRERVVQEEAAALARKAGEAKLAAVRSGEDTKGFGAPAVVSRTDNQGMHGAALMAVMKTDVNKLPAYVGVELPGQGYGVYRINKVIQPETQDAARRQSEQQQIANVLAQQEMYAYVEALKRDAKVEILQPQLRPAGTDQ